MPREIALPLESVLKELFHQRLRIGERNETIAQIARRDDAELRAQPPRGTPVVRDGHDCRDVARQLLDAAQEHGQAMPAADDRNRRTAAETCLLVDEIDKARRCPLRHQRRNDGADDVARRHEHECAAEECDKPSHNRREAVVIAALPRIDKAEDSLLDAVDVFVVEDECGSEPDTECSDREDKEPAFEPHAGVEPFYEMHRYQPSLTCSCTSFFMRSRCSRRAL